MVTTAEQRLKLSVEPALFPQTKVLGVRTSCVELRGAKSSEDIEPSLSSSSESETHNSWNAALGLCCHCYVGQSLNIFLLEGNWEEWHRHAALL